MKKLIKKNTEEDIIAVLPECFMSDLSDDERDFSLVFLIDTFEILDQNKTSSFRVIDILKNQLALGQQTQIGIEDSLWVFAGRNKIYDIESPLISQHSIGDLSKEDTRQYLKEKRDINDETIIERIYDLTGGTPLFLNVCARYHINNPEDDFKSLDLKELIERYLKYLDSKERRILRTMSVVMHWTDEDFKEIFTKAHNENWNMDYEEAYEEVVSTTMIEKIGEQRYFLHRSVRLSIYDDKDFKQEYKENIKEELLSLYGIRIANKNFDSIYYVERIVEFIDNRIELSEQLSEESTNRLGEVIKNMPISYLSLNVSSPFEPVFSSLSNFLNSLLHSHKTDKAFYLLCEYFISKYLGIFLEDYFGAVHHEGVRDTMSLWEFQKNRDGAIGYVDNQNKKIAKDNYFGRLIKTAQITKQYTEIEEIKKVFNNLKDSLIKEATEKARSDSLNTVLAAFVPSYELY